MYPVIAYWKVDPYVDSEDSGSARTLQWCSIVYLAKSILSQVQEKHPTLRKTTETGKTAFTGGAYIQLAVPTRMPVEFFTSYSLQAIQTVVTAMLSDLKYGVHMTPLTYHKAPKEMRSLLTVFSTDEVFDDPSNDAQVARMVEHQAGLLKTKRESGTPRSLMTIVHFPPVHMTRKFADRVCMGLRENHGKCTPMFADQIPSITRDNYFALALSATDAGTGSGVGAGAGAGSDSGLGSSVHS